MTTKTKSVSLYKTSTNFSFSVYNKFLKKVRTNRQIMKLWLYLTISSILFVVFMVSGYIVLFTDLPYKLVFLLLQGASLGGICYLSFIRGRWKANKILET